MTTTLPKMPDTDFKSCAKVALREQYYTQLWLYPLLVASFAFNSSATDTAIANGFGAFALLVALFLSNVMSIRWRRLTDIQHDALARHAIVAGSYLGLAANAAEKVPDKALAENFAGISRLFIERALNLGYTKEMQLAYIDTLTEKGDDNRQPQKEATQQVH